MTVRDGTSRVFAALADPTRRAMLERLEGGPLTVGALAEPFDVSGPAISQHLQVLERAGLVARTARAQWREVSLRPEAISAAAEWIGLHRRAWNARLDRLEARLSDTASAEDGDR